MWIGEMGTAEFRANQYNLFKHNCNNFSEAVSQFLGKRPVLIFSSRTEGLDLDIASLDCTAQGPIIVHRLKKLCQKSHILGKDQHSRYSQA